MVTDLTYAFKEAVRKENYEKYRLNKKTINTKIETRYELFSDYDENLKWYKIIDKNEDGCYKMFLSDEYPIALYFIQEGNLWLKELLANNGVDAVYVDTYYMACAPEYLSFFRSNPSNLFIDDSFFYDDNIPFDYKAYEMIDSGCNYINPFKFTLSDLMNM